MYRPQIVINASLALVLLFWIGCDKPSPPGVALVANGPGVAERSEAFKTMLHTAREFQSPPRLHTDLKHDPEFNKAFRKLIEFKRSSDPEISREAWQTMIRIQDFCPGPEFTAQQWTTWLEEIEATGIGSHTKRS